jgi:N-acylglucosamine-6-phosphate 2-epimerase
VGRVLKQILTSVRNVRSEVEAEENNFGAIEVVQWVQFSGREVFQSLRGRLIVSCQAVAGDPLDDVDTLTRMASAVLRGGAGGLRAEGVACIAAFRRMTEAPLIGLIKRHDAGGDVYITPDFASARAVSEAGADVIALDCTRRRLREAEPWPELIGRIHEELGRPVCADIATIEDAVAAANAGADAVASTLYGYTSDTEGGRKVSWRLVEELVARMTIPVIVEGHVTQPEEVRKALEMGANSVVVGSAITRPESITARFVRAIEV